MSAFFSLMNLNPNDGIIAHKVMIARMKQAWFIALRNMSLSAKLISCLLPTIWDNLSYGITSVISSNENGTLMTFPVWLIVILIPLAIPRFSAETDPITALEFGEKNKAMPKPKRTKLINTAP